MFRRYIEKLLLDEMAFTIKDAERIVTNAGFDIVEHLIKVSMYGTDFDHAGHLLREINTWCQRIANIKLKTPKRTRLTAYEIRKWMFEEWLTEKGYQDSIDANFNAYIGSPKNAKKIYMRYGEFRQMLNRICDELANGSFERNVTIKQEVDAFVK